MFEFKTKKWNLHEGFHTIWNVGRDIINLAGYVIDM